MAIVHMKKLRLMVVRGQKDALLRDLMLLGCVQVSEPSLRFRMFPSPFARFFAMSVPPFLR